MNQQMTLLEAWAVARDREHQTQPDRRAGAVRRRATRGSSWRTAVPSLRRRPASREAARSRSVAAARG